MKNLHSVSTSALAQLAGGKYYDLASSLRVMKMVFDAEAVDGFELQLLPEWDSEGPPLTDAHFADWAKTPKHTIDEVAKTMRKAKLPIFSVHSSRDIGNYLCSTRAENLQKGRRLIHDSLSISDTLGAEVCVFHLWDTRKTSFHIDHLNVILNEISTRFPSVKASVENIPTHLPAQTPFDLVEHFNHITLDTKWAALYSELDRFESISNRIVDVHLRGKLEAGRWVAGRLSFNFYDAIDKITQKWKYAGPLTLEPDGRMTQSDTASFLKAMHSLPS
jgi:hypothetical protein